MTCATLQGSFEAVAPVWRQLLQGHPQGSIFLTPEWQGAWWDQFGGGGYELRLLLVGPEKQPLGLAPLVRHGDTLSFLGDTDLFDYHDFVVGTADPADFFEQLATCMEQESWHTLDLRSLAETSPTLQHLPGRFRSLGLEVSVEQEDVVPGMALPATWDEYLSGLRKKDRHELRRKLRRLAGAGDYRLVSSSPDTLTADVSTFLDLMGESREEKRDFMVPEREAFFRHMVEWTQASDLLRLQFLESGGERVAAVISFDYAGRRLLYNSGYRLAHRALSVGLMLKALCIRDAIEKGLAYFDFLRGPEPYKYHLGASDVGLYRLVVRR